MLRYKMLKYSLPVILFSVIAFLYSACQNPAGAELSQEGTTEEESSDTEYPGVIEDTSYEQDFTGTDGESLVDYGFLGIQNLALNDGGYLETSAPDAENNLASAYSPDFGLIDRNANGGVVVQWSLQFPTEDDGLWKENNRTVLALADSDGNLLYKVLYQPNQPPDIGNWDLQFKASGAGGSLSAITGQVPPHGIGADWVNLKMEIYPTAAAGGSGQIKVFIDFADGNGYVLYIDEVDESHSVFSKLYIQYETGIDGGGKNYFIYIGSMSITPLI